MNKIFLIFILLLLIVLPTLSQSQTDTQKTKEATENYLKKIRSDSENLGIHRALIEEYSEKGLIDIPIGIYKKSAEKNTDNPIVLYVLGYTYLIEGSPEALELSEKYLSMALALKPQFPDALTAYGDYYIKKGNEELALEKWQLARQYDDRFAPVFISLARLYRSKRQYQKAVEEYEEAISLSSNQRGKAYLEFGTMCMEMGDLTKAEEMLLKAKGLEPRFALIHYRLGQLYAMRGENDNAIRLYRSGRKFDPDNAQVAYDLAYIFLEKGETKYSLLSFERGLAVSIIDEKTSKELANRINKNIQQAIDYLAQIAKNHQDNFDLQYFLGKLYLNQKNEELALDYFKKASAMAKTNADIHYQLGLLYEKRQPKAIGSKQTDTPKSEQKPLTKPKQIIIKIPNETPRQTEPIQPIDIKPVDKTENAQDQYRKAVDLGASEADLLFRVAQGYLDEGNEDKYIEVAKKGLEINNNKLDVHLKLADIFLKRADNFKKNEKNDDEEKALLESIRHYEQVTTLEPDGQRWYNLGLLYERAGKSKAVKAVRAYDQAIQLKPEFAMAYYRRGYFRLNYKVGPAKVLMYKPEVAVEDLKKAIELDPKLSDAHLALGMAYYQLDMPEMATEEFEKAVQTDPKNIRAHIYLAQDYAQTGDNQKVIEHLSSAMELDSNNAEILKSLGGMLLKYGSDNDVPKARNALKKANELMPDDPEILMNLGYTLYLASNFNEAIAKLKRAIELQPNYPEAHYNIALAYSRTGEYKLAKEHWERVIEQAPESPIAQKSAEFIDKIKKSK